MAEQVVLEVASLKTHFSIEEGTVKAVDDVSFQVHRGKTLGIVGESGCGKSVTSLSVMRLLSGPRVKTTGEGIFYHKRDGSTTNLLTLDPKGGAMRAIRGKEISMIFQEPMASLDPLYTIGDQICEMICLHMKVSRKEALGRAIRLLERVGISNPQKRVDQYPHELSGGMLQRVVIAIALSCNPALLIADEPTTALDVTIEAQILDLLRDLQTEFGMAIMFITHDLGVIGEMASQVIVMYMGKVVEEASVVDIFYNPKHPYTVGLLKSIPRIGGKERLVPIKGSVASLLNMPSGCSFAPRCPNAMAICDTSMPDVSAVGEGHTVRCFLYDQEGGPQNAE